MTSPSQKLDETCAGLFCVGFEGTSPSQEVVELIRRGVYGVILFRQNIENAEQVAELCGTLKRAAGRPLLVSVDQEGGRVARLRAEHGFTELPAFRALGGTGDPDLARRMGVLLGQELRAVGIDQDYAPVVDVDTNPDNPVIGDRSLSRNPDEVARLGRAFVQGLQSVGVAGCAKHFPGHGDTSQDSHEQLPHLPHSLERLEAVELLPFRTLARAGVASIMTAHVVFDALDPDRPATLSRSVMNLLRLHCGYAGCAISDDLGMKAISEHFSLEEVVPGTIGAGVDALLVCRGVAEQNRAVDLLRSAVESGKLAPERLREARARVEGLLAYAGPPADIHGVRGWLRTAEHLSLAAAISGAGKGQTS